MLNKRKLHSGKIETQKTVISDAGKYWEDKICGRFKKEGLELNKLDKNDGKSGKCIDFFVFKKDHKNQGFFCEIKSINSAGFDSSINAYISSLDSHFLTEISIENQTNLNAPQKNEFDYDHEGFVKKIESALKQAVSQYNESINIVKNGTPFVVVLCFDFVFFPDQVNFEQLLIQFPIISAILTLEKNHERKIIGKKHLDEINNTIKNREQRKHYNFEKNHEKRALDYEGSRDTGGFKIFKNRSSKIAFRPNIFFKHFFE